MNAHFFPSIVSWGVQRETVELWEFVIHTGPFMGVRGKKAQSKRRGGIKGGGGGQQGLCD